MCATLKKGRCEKSLFVDVWFSFFFGLFLLQCTFFSVQQNDYGAYGCKGDNEDMMQLAVV